MRGLYGGGFEGEEKVSWQLIDVLFIYMSFGCEVLLCCVFLTLFRVLWYDILLAFIQSRGYDVRLGLLDMLVADNSFFYPFRLVE